MKIVQRNQSEIYPSLGEKKKSLFAKNRPGEIFFSAHPPASKILVQNNFSRSIEEVILLIIIHLGTYTHVYERVKLLLYTHERKLRQKGCF